MTMNARAAVVALAWALLATAALAQSVVPTRPIRSQSIITAADVGLVQASHPGAVADLDDVIGLEARVTLYPGRPITAGDVGAPAVIDRNQIVTMIYDIGGLRITAEGRALDRAGLGDQVRIINTDSRLTVVGKVKADGTVEVGVR